MHSGLRNTITAALWVTLASCATISEPTPERHNFPKKDASFGKPERPYEVIGVVRTKVNFPTLISAFDERYLCANAFNKSVNELVKMAKDKGADAVVDVKVVTFLMDGKMELYEEPQCFDDGEEGQVLTRGVAIKWKPEPDPEKNAPKRSSAPKSKRTK